LSNDNTADLRCVVYWVQMYELTVIYKENKCKKIVL
jgi:hypothetical protein